MADLAFTTPANNKYRGLHSKHKIQRIAQSKSELQMFDLSNEVDDDGTLYCNLYYYSPLSVQIGDPKLCSTPTQTIGAVCVPELPAEVRDTYVRAISATEGLTTLTGAVARY